MNALSFVFSAGLVVSVRGRFSADRPASDDHRGLRAGFLFLARDRVLLRIALAMLILVLGFGVAQVADVPLARLFRTGSIGYGLMITFFRVGSVLGSLTGRFMNERRELRAVIVAMLLVAVSGVGIAVSPWFAPILAMNLVWGVAHGLDHVAQAGIFQRRAPDAVRSRVMAASETIGTVSYVVSLAAAGFALRAVGPRGSYAISGAIALVAALMLLPMLRPSPAVESMVAPAESGAATQAEGERVAP